MIEPFLVHYSTARTHGESKPGYYSPKLNMWVVEKEGEEVPLINFDKNLVELLTKTETKPEADDQNCASFLELVTKTSTVVEQDDESRYETMIELTTKTKVEFEQDDTSQSVANMFL